MLEIKESLKVMRYAMIKPVAYSTLPFKTHTKILSVFVFIYCYTGCETTTVKIKRKKSPTRDPPLRR